MSHSMCSKDNSINSLVHIQRPLVPSPGYRPKQKSNTCCGAPDGQFDISWNRKNTQPFQTPLGRTIICETCITTRASEKQLEFSKPPVLEVERFLATLDGDLVARIMAIVSILEDDPEARSIGIREYAWNHIRPIINLGGTASEIISMDELLLGISHSHSLRVRLLMTYWIPQKSW